MERTVVRPGADGLGAHKRKSLPKEAFRENLERQDSWEDYRDDHRC